MQTRSDREVDRIAKWIRSRSLVTNSITIQITILIAILITIFITIKRRPKVGSKVGSDKVGLGPKVGSDREKPWLSWSKSGIWANFMESKWPI